MCSIPDLQQSTRLLQSQGMLSMRKALPPWKCLTAFPRLEAPGFQLEPEFQAVPSLSLVLDPSPSQTFKLLGSAVKRKSGNLNHGGNSRSDCRMCSSKTVFPRPCTLPFLETETIATIQSWGWRRFWGHYVQLLLPQVLLTRICICFSHSPPEPAFALRFYLAVHTKHDLYHFHFLKTRCKVPNRKASYLFCFLGWLFPLSCPFLVLSSG